MRQKRESSDYGEASKATVRLSLSTLNGEVVEVEIQLFVFFSISFKESSKGSVRDIFINTFCFLSCMRTSVIGVYN
jgi:hypothetical protein